MLLGLVNFQSRRSDYDWPHDFGPAKSIYKPEVDAENVFLLSFARSNPFVTGVCALTYNHGIR